MKNKICIMINSISLLCFFFLVSIYTFEYLSITTYKKEISLLLGLTSVVLFYLFEKGEAVRMFKKYPVLFWLSLPGSFLCGWQIYSELVNN